MLGRKSLADQKHGSPIIDPPVIFCASPSPPTLNGDHHHTNSLHNHNNVPIPHPNLSPRPISRLYFISPRTSNFRLHHLHRRKSLLLPTPFPLPSLPPVSSTLQFFIILHHNRLALNNPNPRVRLCSPRSWIPRSFFQRVNLKRNFFVAIAYLHVRLWVSLLEESSWVFFLPPMELDSPSQIRINPRFLPTARGQT